MKKFKIKNLDTKFDIGKLLTNYSKSLSEDTNNVLSGLTENRISDGKIIYDYKVKYGENLLCKIFEICLLDMNGNVSLSVFYFKDSETFYIKDTELESKIDGIISSDKMGDFIGYLILINSKQK
jgi:uncharacterized protein YkuJ